jgi:hypothetical protein
MVPSIKKKPQLQWAHRVAGRGLRRPVGHPGSADEGRVDARLQRQRGGTLQRATQWAGELRDQSAAGRYGDYWGYRGIHHDSFSLSLYIYYIHIFMYVYIYTI